MNLKIENDNNNTCFLILGANGFIGRQLTELLSKSYFVRAYDKQFSSELFTKSNVECVTGNLNLESDFEGLLSKITHVIHFAGTSVPSDDTSRIEMEIKSDLLSTVRLLEAMTKYNVKNIIFASSAGVIYGETGDVVNTSKTPSNPCCSYGIIKQTIESYLRLYNRNYGINYKIVRMSNPYGVGQDRRKIQGLIPILIRHMLDGSAIHVYGDEEKLRDYIYLPELIDGLEKVILYEGSEKIFNLGFGEYYTIKQVIEMIEEKANEKFHTIIKDTDRKCDLKKSLVDYHEAHLLLNWFPRVKLYEGIDLLFDQMTLEG